MTFRVNVSLRHAATQNLLRWFEHDHLPPRLAEVAEPMCELAHRLTAALTDGPELSTGLRHLLEAKDCFVRQRIADLDDQSE